MSLNNNTIKSNKNQVTRKNNFYKHLSEVDRKNIKKLYTIDNLSIHLIAKTIGRVTSTISREIKRGTISLGYNTDGQIKKYRLDAGERVASLNKSKSKKKSFLSLEHKLLQLIISNVKKYRLSFYSTLTVYKQNNLNKKAVSLKTLYNYFTKNYLGLKRQYLYY